MIGVEVKRFWSSVFDSRLPCDRERGEQGPMMKGEQRPFWGRFARFWMTPVLLINAVNFFILRPVLFQVQKILIAFPQHEGIGLPFMAKG